MARSRQRCAGRSVRFGCPFRTSNRRSSSSERMALRDGIRCARSTRRPARSARTTSCVLTKTARCSTRTALTTTASSWLLRTGVRVAEARALTVADLDLSPEGESLTVRGSKSPAATRTIPLLPQLFPLVHEHLKFPEAAHGRDARDPTACDGPRHAHDDELSVASGQACGVRSRSPADQLHLRNDTAGSASPRMSSNKLRRESLFRQSSHAEANVRQRSHQPWAPPRGSQQAPRPLQHDNHRACVRATARANHPKELFEAFLHDPSRMRPEL